MKTLGSAILTFFLALNILQAEDGYRLWLRYDQIRNETIRQHYISQIQFIDFCASSAVAVTARDELSLGLNGLLGLDVPMRKSREKESGIIAGIIGACNEVDECLSRDDNTALNEEGFLLVRKTLKSGASRIVIGAKDDRGLLYGVFHVLRLIQRQQELPTETVIINPAIKLRVLDHWDNLDRTVERGYAGFSIWNWHELPDYLDTRYTDYARANASIGINGAVVTNVNANALIFREDYLEKVAALANVFRDYGIKIYLTARFSSPIELGGLATADPLDPDVREWWTKKINEIYAAIPDFGGLLVKANSEGQPGPQNYGRTHADGANLLADVLKPHDGVVMWRAFVYSQDVPDDRAKQAYNEFVPLDGKFRDNVLIQVKNGPIDFQPREPIHPLFGAMPGTPLMMEFQITKEYLGQGTHLVGLASMYEEVLQTDTYAKGKGSFVAKVIDGTLDGHTLTGMAGVSNIGTARNWTGNLFGQADWYALGRLSWDPYLSADSIFQEWTELTFSTDADVVHSVTQMLSSSYGACVDYMTPLGLHHIMAAHHHFGPGPWVNTMSRPDWNSVYYHKADSIGIGFERTASGSNALSQYHEGLQKQYRDLTTCPLEFLLWFHHVPWEYTLSTGNSLWNELCLRYERGIREAKDLLDTWDHLAGEIDGERYSQVRMHLLIQVKEAVWWHDACLAYFQTFSGMPFPDGVMAPGHSLEYYKSQKFPYAPGIRPQW